MIIACPECTSPFQVVDGQIAALVQVECPTCSFRMILDFEAANDASLREAGMKMAQGFQNEVAYRQAVGQTGGFAQDAAKPELRAAPEPERRPVAAPEPAPQPAPQPAPEPAPVRVPTARPTSEPEPTVAPAADTQPAKPPVRPRPRPTLIAQTAPPPVRQPTDFTAPVQVEPTPQPAHAEAHIATHVGPAPQPEYSAQLEASDDGFDDGVSVDMDDVEDMDIDVDVAAGPQAEQRRPPHTPAAQDSSTSPTQVDPALAVDLESSDPANLEKDPSKRVAQDPAKPKKSVLGGVLKVFLLLLLLLVGGLMTWSLIVNQDADPRRLLQEQFGIDLGVPVPAPAQQPADGAAADDKADADGGKDDDNG